MSVLEELHMLVEKMNANPEHFNKEKDSIYQVNLTPSGVHLIIFENGHVRVEEGKSSEAVVKLTLTDENFSKLLCNQLNTLTAFMTGGLKVEGSVGYALKLQEILKNYQ